MAHIPPAFVQPVQFLVFNIVWTYIASVLTGNASQVDRVWTFLPTLYTAYFTFYPLLDGVDPAIKSHGVHPRALIMLSLQVCHTETRAAYRLIGLWKTIWMIRLSYNTWRRGLFSLYQYIDFSLAYFNYLLGKMKITAGPYSGSKSLPGSFRYSILDS